MKKSQQYEDYILYGDKERDEELLSKFRTKKKDVRVNIKITKEQKKFLKDNKINMSLLFSIAIENLKRGN